MVKIQVLNKRFEVKGKFLGANKPDWDKENLHNNFRIFVKNLENQKKVSFLFWDSIENYEKGKTELTEEDLIYCFKMLLEDALNYLENPDIDEFAKELGYEKVSDVIRAFNGCKKQLEKVIKLGIDTNEEIYELINAITKLILYKLDKIYIDD
jgi:hypothetical protein